MNTDLDSCREIVTDVLCDHFMYTSILALSAAAVFHCAHAFHEMVSGSMLKEAILLSFQIRDYLTNVSTQDLAVEKTHIEVITTAIVSVVRPNHAEETNDVSSSSPRHAIAA